MGQFLCSRWILVSPGQRCLLPISFLELVLSQGWMTVFTVLAYLLIEMPAGIYPRAVLLLGSLRGTDTEHLSLSCIKVSCENSPLGYLI